MKPMPKLVFFISFAAGLGLLFLASLPHGRQEDELSIQQESSLFPDDPGCSSFRNLKDAKYFVSYPRSIYFHEAGNITVIIENLNPATLVLNDTAGMESCRLSWEVWIDGKNLLVEPGERIIETVADAKKYEFRFEIMPLTKSQKKGTIWIYVVNSNEKKGIERMPLFAIPFSFHVISLMGMKPEVIKFLAISIILFSVFLFWLQLDKQKNRE